jgi:hypothetical protein
VPAAQAQQASTPVNLKVVTFPFLSSFIRAFVYCPG